MWKTLPSHRCYSKKHKIIITIEDGILLGGFGSSILEFASKKNYHIPIITLGISDDFPNQGTVDELQDIAGISSKKIIQTLNTFI